MKFRSFPYPIFVTIIYFLIGASTNHWDYNWLVYLTVPIYYSLVPSDRSVKKQEPPKKHEDWSNF